MVFEFNRYSALLLIFFVHGLVYAILLLRKGIQNDRSSDKWLSLFLVLCILYICPWMLGYAGWYYGPTCLECRNFMFYTPMQHTLLMGPVIYFYTQSLLNPQYHFQKKDARHLLPAGLYLLWNVVVFVTDRVVLGKYYLMDGQNDPDFQPWYIITGLISLLVYIIISIRYYNNYRRFIVQELSFADSVTYQWVRNFLIACFIYFLSTLVFDILDFLQLAGDTRGAWWYYLAFAILFYYIAITGYSNSIETRVHFKLDFLKYSPALLLSSNGEPEPEVEDIAYEDITAETKNTSPDTMAAWKEKLLTLVESQHKYRDPNLTLTQLAAELETNPSFLSKLINQGFGMNFNDFINGYRVKEVQQKMSDPANAHLTIMSMAYDAGFNSKATFNRSFKKITGKNPKEYLS